MFNAPLPKNQVHCLNNTSMCFSTRQRHRQGVLS